MQPTMHVPLDEVHHHKQHCKLCPGWQLRCINPCEVGDARDRRHTRPQCVRDDVAHRPIAKRGKQEEVEHHPPRIKPEVFAERCLPLAPWHDDLERPHEERQSDDPVEEVIPRRMHDLIAEIRDVSREAAHKVCPEIFHTAKLQRLLYVEL